MARRFRDGKVRRYVSERAAHMGGPSMGNFGSTLDFVSDREGSLDGGETTWNGQEYGSYFRRG